MKNIKQLYLLTKVQCASLFTFRNKKNSSRTLSKKQLPIIAIAYVLLNLLVGVYIYGIGQLLLMLGVLDILPMVVMVFASFLIFMTCVQKVKGSLFGFKDYTLLMSLPISNLTLVISRILSIYIFELLVTSIAMIPTMIVYGVLASPTSGFYIISCLLLFIIPIVPMIVAIFIGFLLGFISERFRFSNVISVILNLLITVGIIYGSMSFTSIDMNLKISSDEIVKVISKVYPFAGWYHNGVVGFDILEMIYYIMTSFVLFFGSTYVVAKNFKKMNSMFDSKYSKGNYKHKELLSSSKLVALYKKEIKRYFSSSIYVLNTSVTLVLITIASISLFFIKPDKLFLILEIPQMADSLSMIAPIGVSIACSMAYITGCSISLEGNNLWILLKAPLREKDIFLSKILTNMTITVPILLINGIIFSVILKFSWLETVIQIALPLGVTILSSILGLIINIKLPRLDYKSEVYVVKQSAAAFICMLIGFIPIAAVAFIEVICKKNGLDYGMGIGTVFIYVLAYFSYQYLNKYSAKEFRSLANS